MPSTRVSSAGRCDQRRGEPADARAASRTVCWWCRCGCRASGGTPLLDTQGLRLLVPRRHTLTPITWREPGALRRHLACGPGRRRGLLPDRQPGLIMSAVQELRAAVGWSAPAADLDWWSPMWPRPVSHPRSSSSSRRSRMSTRVTHDPGTGSMGRPRRGRPSRSGRSPNSGRSSTRRPYPMWTGTPSRCGWGGLCHWTSRMWSTRWAPSRSDRRRSAHRMARTPTSSWSWSGSVPGWRQSVLPAVGRSAPSTPSPAV